VLDFFALVVLSLLLLVLAVVFSLLLLLLLDDPSRLPTLLQWLETLTPSLRV
jgi:hypothetical protein